MPTKEVSAPAHPSLDQIWTWLCQIADPEIPVVSVVDLGIVREVAWGGETPETCVVTVTPTYSGCPAIAVIQSCIREELKKRGIQRVKLQSRLSPPWTSDWLSEQAIEKLRNFGIAPPARHADHQPASILPVLNSAEPHPPCPHCGSTRTAPISHFGSTLCKALYRCEQCLEPFDYFKCH